VTHDPRLMYYADRVFHMEDGRMISEEVRTRTVSANDPANPSVMTPPPRRVNLAGLMEGITIGY